MPGMIITGGPGSGKSTLLEALKLQGFDVVPEVSRQIIREQVVAGSDSLPWIDLAGFAGLCLDKMVADFEMVLSDAVTFFDRGIPDILAYLKAGGLEIESRFSCASAQNRYATMVFVAPPWKQIYINDNERWQTFEEAVALYHAICEVYSNEGYQIVELPLATVAERVEFIMQAI